MILRQTVNFGGRLYAEGENVRGKLPADYLAVLAEKGVIDNTQTDESATEAGGKSDGDETALTVAELREKLPGLSAEDVKSLLEQEQAAESPRDSAVKLLEKRLKELSDAGV